MKFHKNLTQKKWETLPKEKQILHIATELSRAKFWLEKKNEKQFLNCLNRALELIDLTANAFSQKRTLRELLRFREILTQFYIEKDKDVEEFKKILRALLMLDKLTSLVKI